MIYRNRNLNTKYKCEAGKHFAFSECNSKHCENAARNTNANLKIHLSYHPVYSQ